VKRYGGIPPFRETERYVKRVLNNYAKRNEQLKQFGASHTTEGEMTLR
jgi:soluble lytic murein transglycosylase-like protein